MVLALHTASCPIGKLFIFPEDGRKPAGIDKQSSYSKLTIEILLPVSFITTSYLHTIPKYALLVPFAESHYGEQSRTIISNSYRCDAKGETL